MNALIREKSPYLQQHASNPVDWMPWGEPAFEKARREDKPIFLSIGYSTCHWCHVMAHESFESEAVATVLNREFVPVKVDREERPDVDRIYMLFVQASTGSGGWPMSVWLTPQLRPFFGGTYFPPDSRYGRPGFRDLLEYIARIWKQEREKLEESSADAVEQLRSIAASAEVLMEPDRELFQSAFWQFRRMFDSRCGGFGDAPKFPRPVVFNYLLRYQAASGANGEQSQEALEMVIATLRAMAKGGIHDHLGGGFHRYSVDERWFVPHFEKMLYDQAQLAVSYLEAYQITQDRMLAEVARDIFSYVLRDLRDETGAFYSAEDADSPDPDNPGHSSEGAFYLWKSSEIERLLGAAGAKAFCARFGVTEEGNVRNDLHGEFRGRNILYLADENVKDENLAEAKRILFEARSKRPRPHLDRKILTSWNGLMISALAKGATILNEPSYLDAAERATQFLLARMYDARSGLLLRRFCEGEAAVPAFLDDYAFLAQGLLDLFEASLNPLYLDTALKLAKNGIAKFEDCEHGGFFSTTGDTGDLLLRIKDDYDGAEPSGNSLATEAYLRIAQVTGDDELRKSAGRSLKAFAPKLKAQPSIAPQMLAALGRWLGEPEQIVIRCAEITSDVNRLLNEYRKTFRSNAVVLAVSDELAKQLAPISPFLSGLPRKGTLTLYECRNFACELPKVLA